MICMKQLFNMYMVPQGLFTDKRDEINPIDIFKNNKNQYCNEVPTKVYKLPIHKVSLK
jgi:hypothetical protein